MSYNMHDTFVRREEWKAARLTEIEFEDMVRALRTMAVERGQDAKTVVDCFAEKGLGAALGVLANLTGASVEADFHRRHAQEQQHH
ncbi:hypothetical protein [Novosphingobium cyanobacteriorum]|uniref:Uncharacterized protein n=1 Tax=Novosphingobium cyanobacteriorum TaxID=3024215 RepID=A0ABT6CHW4_9SPHN|nr:hypothetical protein [Novosphingobium cyanobacteriorum]MDF8333515.1 hypothetical protein [Novosphingobium cyanobacteriorum]